MLLQVTDESVTQEREQEDLVVKVRAASSGHLREILCFTTAISRTTTHDGDISIDTMQKNRHELYYSQKKPNLEKNSKICCSL